MTNNSERSYLPAAGHHWSLPLYDPLVKLLGGDAARTMLLDQAEIQPGHRVLDIGCGTGTLLVLLKRQYPTVDAVGLDPDPKALARAKRKGERASVSMQLEQGFSDELPFPNKSFDRVFSSFMLHHLEHSEKEATLRDVRRVLKPGGTFHLLDFLAADANSASWLSRRLHSGHQLKDNSDERILDLLTKAGLANGACLAARSLLVGQIAYFKAAAPVKSHS
jgi:ubiquinone/menaquinone biosynthesis C-methylase UbiE